MPVKKIATCSYCGTRAVLVLEGDSRHDLTCSSCGAPIESLELLPNAGAKAKAGSDKSTSSKLKAEHKDRSKPKSKKSKKEKKRKGFAQRFMDEAWDVIDDIFD